MKDYTKYKYVIRIFTLALMVIFIMFIFNVYKLSEILCTKIVCQGPPVFLLFFFSISSLVFLWSLFYQKTKFPVKLILYLMISNIAVYFLLPKYQDYILPESKVVIFFIDMVVPVIYLMYLLRFYLKNRK